MHREEAAFLVVIGVLKEQDMRKNEGFTIPFRIKRDIY